MIGSPNSWSINSSYKFDSYSGDFKKLSSITISSGAQFKIIYNNSYYGSNYCFKDTDGSACFSINHSGGDDNIECTQTGTFDIVFNVSSHYFYIYMSSLPATAGYYIIGNNEFGSWSMATAIKMSNDPSGGNVGIIESESGMYLTQNTNFKVIYYDGQARVIYYNIESAGGTYVSGDWSFNTNYDGEAHYTGSGSYFNFYLQSVTGGSYTGNQNTNGTASFFIVDINEIDKYGMLYITSNQDASTLKVTSKVGTSDTVLNNVFLSSVTGFHECTGIYNFDGYSHLYLVPVFNLRGGDATKLVDRLEINDGTSRAITYLPTSASSTIKYYYCSSGSASVTFGYCATVVAKYAEYINAATNQSVCNISQSDATYLKNLYETTSTQYYDLHENAYLYTYTGTVEQGTKGSVAMPDIYAQICSIATTGHPLNGRNINLDIFGLKDGRNNLIVVIVVSTLTVTAVGGYFFLRRKKQK